jgi:hypothetical protein
LDALHVTIPAFLERGDRSAATVLESSVAPTQRGGAIPEFFIARVLRFGLP